MLLLRIENALSSTNACEEKTVRKGKLGIENTYTGIFFLQLMATACADSPEDFLPETSIQQEFDDIDIEEDDAQEVGDQKKKYPDEEYPGPKECDLDEDNDGDGTRDCEDECPNDPDKIKQGVCGCGIPDEDSDGDGTMNCQDSCPADPEKTIMGICGCGASDEDYDRDGVVNCHDGCPDDPDKVAPGACGCGKGEKTCSYRCVEYFKRELAVLECEGQRIISSIEFASFGDPTGTCDSDEPGMGDCHSTKSELAIEEACMGRHQCAFVVEKSVLGDPRCGRKVEERLVVQYICRAPDA